MVYYNNNSKNYVLTKYFNSKKKDEKIYTRAINARIKKYYF